MSVIEDKSLVESTQVMLVTVDPARDTVEQLGQYVPYFNQSFVGVTGEFLKVHSFATNLSAPFQKVPGGGKNYLVDHSSYIFVINPRGDYHGFFKPPFSPEGFAYNYESVRALHKDL